MFGWIVVGVWLFGLVEGEAGVLLDAELLPSAHI
jgi:hypothetical protein